MIFFRGRFFLLLFVCTFKKSISQQNDFSAQIKFAKYLANKHLYKESQYILQQLDTAILSPAQRDTINFELGWNLYNRKELKLSSNYLLKVSAADENYFKSRYFSGYNQAFLKQYARADSIFTGIVTTDTVYEALKNFELAGLALLERKFTSFDSLKAHFSYNYYAFSEEERKLQENYFKLKSYNKKSPILAGIYSALLPGAGRFYAGKKKQAIGSLFQLVGLGLLTYEAYKKDGVKSARFMAFGSLFTLFYTANIWGSVVSVKIKAKEYNNYYDNKILFDMHIPLRNIFN